MESPWILDWLIQMRKEETPKSSLYKNKELSLKKEPEEVQSFKVESP